MVVSYPDRKSDVLALGGQSTLAYYEVIAATRGLKHLHFECPMTISREDIPEVVEEARVMRDALVERFGAEMAADLVRDWEYFAEKVQELAVRHDWSDASIGF